MVISSLRKLFFISSVLVILILVSCQKEIDIDLDNPPPIPGEVKDSTLLIKSIGLTFFEPGSGMREDSILEVYTYDTLNRKIIITDQYTEARIEHTYNENGLLTNVLYKYPAGTVPADDDMGSVKLDYDADKILKKISIHYHNGDIKTTIFNKTTLAAGKYQLKWIEPLFGGNGNGEDTAFRNAVFDETGKLRKKEFSYSYKAIIGGGLDVFTKIINTDSVYYDVNGSVTKIVANHIDTFRHINDTLIRCEFYSRHSKGDQLYNMEQVMFNGIAAIPLGEDLFRGSISGILSYGGLQSMGYSKYPFQTAKVYNGRIYEYENATGTSEFDSKDRLVKFNGFFDDAELIPLEYKITYYK